MSLVNDKLAASLGSSEAVVVINKHHPHVEPVVKSTNWSNVCLENNMYIMGWKRHPFFSPFGPESYTALF
jgi:hypothetical protein